MLVFPPSQLPSPTTIDPGDYTTSLLYGTTTETIKSGETITAFVTQTTTITIDLPVITTDELSYSNVNISRNQDTSSLWVGVSVPIAPVTVSLDDGGGGTTTRVLTLPAWPAVTKGPRPDGDNDDDEDNDDEDWELPNPIETTATIEPTEVLHHFHYYHPPLSAVLCELERADAMPKMIANSDDLAYLANISTLYCRACQRGR